MGRSKRRMREQEQHVEAAPHRDRGRSARRAESAQASAATASYGAGLPEVLGIDRRFWKFAVAFLIIFVLLWLLAPEDE